MIPVSSSKPAVLSKERERERESLKELSLKDDAARFNHP